MNDHKIRLILLLIICATIAQIISEGYVPALPSIQAHFRVTESNVQLSLSVFLLCTALPCIFVGYISDALGRKNILVFSFLICGIGSLICSLSPSISLFIFGRAIQGIGCSGIASTSRAILRDKYDGIKLAKASSYMSICISLAIDLSPFMGSILLVTLGWRYIFVLFSIYSLLGFFSSISLKNLDSTYKTPLQFTKLAGNLLEIFRNLKYIKYCLISALVYGLWMVYFSMAGSVKIIV